MAGFDLKEGKYEDREVTEDDLWNSIACIFTSKSRNDASYKYGFLRSILDNLQNVDYNFKLTFDQLFTVFTEIYWTLILKYRLQQKGSARDNRRAVIERILDASAEKYGSSEYTPFEELSIEARNDVIHQVKQKCKTYVVGALFKDTNQLFYSFSKAGEWIQMNPKMYLFLCRHKEDINQLNDYEWAHFLSKINSGYSANQILKQCFLNDRKVLVNTTSLLFEAEEIEYRSPSSLPELNFNADEQQETIKEIDEEAIKLLDDPVSLIKLLKKRRGL